MSLIFLQMKQMMYKRLARTNTVFIKYNILLGVENLGVADCNKYYVCFPKCLLQWQCFGLNTIYGDMKTRWTTIKMEIDIAYAMQFWQITKSQRVHSF